MSAAKHALSLRCVQAPARLQWIFTPFGHKFFLNENWKYGAEARDSMFSNLGNKVDPLAYVMKVYAHFVFQIKLILIFIILLKVYREKLLEKALHAIVTPDSQNSELSNNSHSSITDALMYIEWLQDNVSTELTVARSASVTNEVCMYCIHNFIIYYISDIIYLFFVGCEDEKAHWWSCISGIAAKWFLGQDADAQNLYSRAENLPCSLSKNDDPLPRAVLASFKARKMFLEKKKSECSYIHRHLFY